MFKMIKIYKRKLMEVLDEINSSQLSSDNNLLTNVLTCSEIKNGPHLDQNFIHCVHSI